MSRFVLSLLSLSLLSAISGCSSEPPMGTVTGKVMVNGTAVTEKDSMRIYFINSMIGQGSDALVGADGTYKLRDSLKPAEYTIYFSKHLADATGPVSTAQETLSIIAKEYRNEMSSPLKKTVEAGANTIDLDISGPPPKK